jgi:hypothetical protein
MGAAILPLGCLARRLLGSRASRDLWLVVPFGLPVLGTSTPARAGAGPTEEIHLTYEAPEGCPSEAQFLEAVDQNGGHLTRVGSERRARTFVVTIELARPAVGRLVIHNLDGRDAVRPIDGERCEDVVQSLAVLVALSLDPERPDSPPPRLPPEPPARKETSTEVAVPLPREGWRLGAEAHLGALGDGSVVWGLDVEALDDLPGAFAPSLRLGFERTLASDSVGRAPGPTASVSRTLGRAEACPVRWKTTQRRWSPTTTVAAHLCARGEVGVLDVQPGDGKADVSRPWVATAGTLRLRATWSFLFLDLEGGATFPLVRDRFFFEPATNVYEVPPIAAAFELGFGGFFL